MYMYILLPLYSSDYLRLSTVSFLRFSLTLIDRSPCNQTHAFHYCNKKNSYSMFMVIGPITSLVRIVYLNTPHCAKTTKPNAIVEINAENYVFVLPLHLCLFCCYYCLLHLKVNI